MNDKNMAVLVSIIGAATMRMQRPTPTAPLNIR